MKDAFLPNMKHSALANRKNWNKSLAHFNAKKGMENIRNKSDNKSETCNQHTLECYPWQQCRKW